MAGKQGEDPQGIDEYEFYLAEDLVELDIDLGTDDPTPIPARRIPADRRPTDDRSSGSALERGVIGKKLTAREALAAALAAEAEKEAAEQRRIQAAIDEKERQKKAELARQLAVQAARRVEAEKLAREEAEAAEEAEWARAAFGGSKPGVAVAGAKRAPSAELPGLPSDAVVMDRYDDLPIALLGPLMAAHQARAEHEGDLAGAVAFTAIRKALEAQPGALSAARVVYGDEEWAVWLLGEGVIAALHPAAVYLVGLE